MSIQTSVASGPTRSFWLGRYGRPIPIQRCGAFLLASTFRIDDGLPCVVLIPGPEAEPARAAEVFAKLERAHNTLLRASVPRVLTRGTYQQMPFLEFDCDATMDGVALHRILIDTQRRAPLSAAVVLASELSRALRATHELRDPSLGRPVCLGRLSYANVLFAPSGRFYLVGLGHNFPVYKPCGLLDGRVTTFQAPEVALGGAPSPMGDHVALHLLLRSLLPVVDLGPELLRVLSGEPGPGDQEILECLRWPDLHLLAAPPSQRGTLVEADAVAARLRELCSVRPDPEGFARFVREAIQGASPPPGGPAGRRTLTLGVEVSWALGTDGTRHVFGQAHRRIVMALAELHRCSPGAVLAVKEICEAGWPGERMVPEAGANRVYVALTQLRRMGMRDFIERCDGGYRFAPDLVIDSVD